MTLFLGDTYSSVVHYTLYNLVSNLVICTEEIWKTEQAHEIWVSKKLKLSSWDSKLVLGFDFLDSEGISGLFFRIQRGSYALLFEIQRFRRNLQTQKKYHLGQVDFSAGHVTCHSQLPNGQVPTQFVQDKSCPWQKFVSCLSEVQVKIQVFFWP